MQRIYVATSNPPYDPYVEFIQKQLNQLRKTLMHSLPEIKPVDGKYGKQTKTTVGVFQYLCGIRIDGIWGDQCRMALAQKIREQPGKRDMMVFRDVATASYRLTTNASNTLYNIDSVVNPNEKRLALIFEEWSKAITHQQDALDRRIKNFSGTKKMRARNVEKKLEKCQEFIDNAKRYGINTAAAKMGTDSTKENALKYIQEIGDTISKSPLTKTLRAATKSFEKVKNVLTPVIQFLNKIPGLKYASVIEKLVKGGWAMLHCDFEGAFKIFLNALRELLEQIIIDAAVVALIAAGGWACLVLAIVVVIGAALLDYFIFSDNPGDSIADKKFNVQTRNILDSGASWTYHTIYK